MVAASGRKTAPTRMLVQWVRKTVSYVVLARRSAGPRSGPTSPTPGPAPPAWPPASSSSENVELTAASEEARCGLDAAREAGRDLTRALDQRG
jgi:hypothetical protein